MDARLVFLSMDEPKQIIEQITTYPEFKAMYEHVCSMCRNVEDAMGIFSEELKILDRNTATFLNFLYFELRTRIKSIFKEKWCWA